MDYSNSTYSASESRSSIQLNCGNLRICFWAFSLFLWMFILVLLCQFAAYSHLPKLAAFARATNTFFGNSRAFMIGPGIVVATFLYFAYSRTKLTWSNGLLIDDKPVSVENYQFRDFFNGSRLIYLQSAGRLWIVYPVTSQTNFKFKDQERLQRDTAANEVMMKQLQEKLGASAAKEKSFWFFTWGVVASFLILLAVMGLALSGWV